MTYNTILYGLFMAGFGRYYTEWRDHGMPWYVALTGWLGGFLLTAASLWLLRRGWRWLSQWEIRRRAA